MIQRLFVYGTLAPGRPNEHIGVLVQEGWGFEHGYPAIALDAAAPRRPERRGAGLRHSLRIRPLIPVTVDLQ